MATAVNATSRSAVASTIACSCGLAPCTVNNSLDGIDVMGAAIGAEIIVIEKSWVVVSLQAVARSAN